jgi:hypothetical protein
MIYVAIILFVIAFALIGVAALIIPAGYRETARQIEKDHHA